MGGVCMCISWTWRPVWPVFVILVALPCILHCSDSHPAAGDGKMYPRGNHWAVGHLMGKKSADSLAELQDAISDYLTPSEAAEVTGMERYERLMEALKQQKNRRQMVAERLLRLGSGWREENRDKYLREMSNLLLLVLRLQEDDST